MIKECKVLINNAAVTVVDFDGAKIQVPSIGREATTVKVLNKNGKYTVVDDNYIEPAKVKVQHDEYKEDNDEKKTTDEVKVEEPVEEEEFSFRKNKFYKK